MKRKRPRRQGGLLYGSFDSFGIHVYDVLRRRIDTAAEMTLLSNEVMRSSSLPDAQIISTTKERMQASVE